MSQIAQQTLLVAGDTFTLPLVNRAFGAALFSWGPGSGTYVTGVVAFEIQAVKDAAWTPIGYVDLSSPSNALSGNFSPTNSTAYTVRVDRVDGAYAVRMKLVSLSSGTGLVTNGTSIPVEACTASAPAQSINTATTVQNITSTSATAFTVGPNGTTNPAFSVNANTASAATGLTVIAAAAGAGVAFTVISSASNESMNLTPKGTGVVRAVGPFLKKATIGADPETGAISASNLLADGIFTATGSGTYTMPTAALLVAAIPNAKVGDSFDFVFYNSSGVTLTLAAGVGGTRLGLATVTTLLAKRVTFQISNVTAASEAYTFFIQ